MGLVLAETSEPQVHPSTVWRHLARGGPYGRAAPKRLYLRHGNKTRRLHQVMAWAEL